MEQAFFSAINVIGYPAIFGLILLENLFPPIPSELVLPLSGYLTLKSSMTLIGVIIASSLGSIAGAYLLYGLGAFFSRKHLHAIVETKVARLLGFKGSDIDKSLDWFDKKGQISVFLCRFIPGVRSLISIPAGCARMGLVRFGLYTTIGSVIWNTVLCYIGVVADDAWESAANQAAFVIDTVKYLVIALILAACVWWFFKRILPNLKK